MWTINTKQMGLAQEKNISIVPVLLALRATFQR